MSQVLRILLVEDSEDDAQLLLLELMRGGYDVEHERVETPAAMKAALEQGQWDLILCDYSLPQFNAPQALEILQASSQDLPFIIVSGTIGEESAVSALKAGAHDFLIKGNFARLGPAIERELREAQIRRERRQAEAEIKQRLAELEALQRVSFALRDADSLHEMLSLLLDETLEVMGTEAGTIKLFDPLGGTLVSAVSRGWYKEIEDLIVRPGEGVSGTVFSTGKPYLAREFASDAITLESSRPRIPAGWGGACVPIRSARAITGVLFVAVPLPRELAEADLRLLTILAEIAGSAIHRMKLHEETLQQLERLSALHDIDLTISSSFDLNLTMNVVLNQAIRLLKVDAASVLLIEADSNLVYAAGTGFWTPSIQSTRLRLGEGLAGRAVLERTSIKVENLAYAETSFPRRELLAEENFVSYANVPLIVKGHAKGVLEVFNRSPLKQDADWLRFLETLAGQTAIAIDNSLLFRDLQRSNMELMLAYDATIEGWSHALDLRDRETEGHTLRVTEMTLSLARAMGISEESIVQIRRGALLHDIGKMGVPDNILLKPAKLTDDEWQVMREHPQLAYDMLAPISYLKGALEIPYSHHEKWNGTGYPLGLEGEQIPLSARIFAVADVWDALTSDRPYRQAWSAQKTLDYIRENSGSHFDPGVVDIFIKHMSNGGNKQPYGIY